MTTALTFGMTTLLTKERKASWSATFGTGAQIEDKMKSISLNNETSIKYEDLYNYYLERKQCWFCVDMRVFSDNSGTGRKAETIKTITEISLDSAPIIATVLNKLGFREDVTLRL